MRTEEKDRNGYTIRPRFLLNETGNIEWGGKSKFLAAVHIGDILDWQRLTTFLFFFLAWQDSWTWTIQNPQKDCWDRWKLARRSWGSSLRSQIPNTKKERNGYHGCLELYSLYRHRYFSFLLFFFYDN